MVHLFPLSNRLYANGIMCSCEPEEEGEGGEGETTSSWGEFLIKAPWGSWQRQPGRWGNSDERWSQCLPLSSFVPDRPESARWKGRTEGDRQAEEGREGEIWDAAEPRQTGVPGWDLRERQKKNNQVRGDGKKTNKKMLSVYEKCQESDGQCACVCDKQESKHGREWIFRQRTQVESRKKECEKGEERMWERDH